MLGHDLVSAGSELPEESNLGNLGDLPHIPLFLTVVLFFFSFSTPVHTTRHPSTHTITGAALVKAGEALQKAGDLTLDMETKVREGYLNPLTALQDKEIKEITHQKKKLESRRLDYDAKRNAFEKSKKRTPPHTPFLFVLFFLFWFDFFSQQPRQRQRSTRPRPSTKRPSRPCASS